MMELSSYAGTRVRDLKIELHTALNMPIFSFRLLHGTEDLQDIWQLGECFEPSVLENAADGQPISLTLLRLSGVHAEWLNRWYEITPAWLTTAGCSRIIGQDEFRSLGITPKPAAPTGAASAEPRSSSTHFWTARRFMRYVPHLLDSGSLDLQEVGHDMLLLKHGTIKAHVDRSDFLAAVDEIPALLGLCSGHVGRALALEVLQSDEKLFRHLPESLREDSCFLNELFSHVPAMCEEFLQTAGRTEVNKFLWREEEDAMYERTSRRHSRRGGKRR